MIRELTAMGFKFSLVLADSLYGESNGNFISVLNELKLNFAVAIVVTTVSGYRLDKRLGTINGVNLLGYFLMVLTKSDTFEKSFWQASCHSILANYN
jgi:hypothetical protein